MALAASFVGQTGKIVDIGTDHAYLPAYLVLNGKIKSAIACDIGIKPLENARKTVEAYSLSDKIELRISDGLEAVLPNEASEIVICGMGGTLMSEILSRATWIKRDGMHLILQPMTHSEEVRAFLCENGFYIASESFVRDNGKVYCCISAEYTGKKYSVEAGYLYFGSLSFENEAAEAFADMRLQRLDKKINALKNTDSEKESLSELLKIKAYYERRKNGDRS